MMVALLRRAVRHISHLSIIRAGIRWHRAHLMSYALGIVESSPFTIDVMQPKIPISQAGELRVKVKMRSNEKFNGAIQIQPDWYPPGVSAGGILEIPAGESESRICAGASSSAKPGTYRLIMNGHTKEGDWESGVGVRRISSSFL